MQPLLQARNLTKRYPGVTALDEVTVSLAAGRIHGLLGENGAGKSTLIKILAGVLQADSGDVLLEGGRLDLRTPLDARRAGIAVVHQHTHLIPDLSIAENLALRMGYQRTRVRSVNWSEVNRNARQATSFLLPTLDVYRLARSLSGVEKQLVELAFALSSTPKVLILDEPTAVLPRQETEQLFERVREFVTRGTAVLFISHRLEEVLELTDHVTVLRDGQRVSSKPTEDTDHQALIQAMVGRAVSFDRGGLQQPEEDVTFEALGLTDEAEAFVDVSLSVRRGEVYGIYGLVGAGQSELCHALFGLRATSPTQTPSRSVKLDGTDLADATPGERVAEGLAYVPADRHTQGVLGQMSVGENLSLASMAELRRRGLISATVEGERNTKQIADLRVRTLGGHQSVAELSGGNQQKVLLGRWLLTEPRVLLLEEPTQGVDVGAKGQIHDIIKDMSRRGVTTIVVSSEIPELIALTHRIGVLREGRLVAELDPEQASEEELLRLSLPEHRHEDHAVEKKQSVQGVHWLPRFAQGLVRQREAGLAIVTLVACAIFALTVERFATVENLLGILESNSIQLVGALGMTMVIIAGGIDISVGAMLGLAAFAAGGAAQAGFPAMAVCFAALGLGCVLGCVNGVLSVVGRVHSIVITLGTLSIYRAAIIQVTGGKQQINLPPSVTWLADTRIFGVLPMLLVVAVIAAVGVHWFLNHTVAGRSLYVLGGDRDSAGFLGIYPRHVLPLAFGLCGLLTGMSGWMYAGRFGNVQSTVAHESFELSVIAAAVIGGTHIMGGRGSAIGTFLGTMLLGVFTNALLLMKVAAIWQQAVIGSVILLAVGGEALLTRLEGRRQ